jgi:hypothetical protein
MKAPNGGTTIKEKMKAAQALQHPIFSLNRPTDL